jgi:hypothetical protein
MDRRIAWIGFVLAIGCLGMTAPDAGAAQPVRIELTGEVTASDIFTLVPGDPVTVSLYVDAQTSDENSPRRPREPLATSSRPSRAQLEISSRSPPTP